MRPSSDERRPAHHLVRLRASDGRPGRRKPAPYTRAAHRDPRPFREGEPRVNPWTLAIDYGTTYTAAAIGRPGSVELLYFNGVPRIPSLILRNEAGDILVGTTAENETLISPDRVLRAPKRRLGDRMVLLGDAPLAVVDAIAAVLAAVLEEARRQQGGSDPSRVVMTHPARWGGERLAALADAAKRAGLPPPEFVAEPVAAALHYMATADETIESGQRVAVYDLGGGTFDTAVLERESDGGFRIVATGGSEYQGGEDFDEILYRHFGELLAEDASQAWEQLRHSDERPWQKANAEFRRDVRLLKEDLSTTNARSVYVRYPVDRELQLTRSELEGLLRPELERTLDELAATIQRSGSQPEELAAIYLVGGSSRIRLLPQLVRDRFGRADTRDDPKAVVALGAARGDGVQEVLGEGAPAIPEAVSPVSAAPPDTRPSDTVPSRAALPLDVPTGAELPAKVVAGDPERCPRCDRARNGTGPYCNGCGYAFDAAAVQAGSAASPSRWARFGPALRWARFGRAWRRKPLAVAGLAAAAVIAIAVLVSANLAGGSPDPSASGSLTSVSATELEVGDCFDPTTAGGGEEILDRVEIVPCDEPHRYEVYSAFEHPSTTASYPRARASRSNLAKECRDRGNEFVGVPMGDADLEGYLLIPLEDQWEAGDRTITCALRRPGGVGTLNRTQEGRGDN